MPKKEGPWWVLDPAKFQESNNKFYFNGKTGETTFDPSPNAAMDAQVLQPPQAPSLVDELKESSRKFWKSNDAHTKGFRMMLAGGLAGAVAKTTVAPLERIKMLLQVHGMTAKPQAKTPGMLTITRSVLMTDGPIGFWKGNVANVVRIIPTKGVLFACNDQLRTLFQVDPSKPDPLRLIGCGASAGMVSTLCTYPLDLVRSRLMMMQTSGSTVRGSQHQHYTGIVDCLTKTYRGEGVRGLYAGLGPTMCGIIPYAGISFGAFGTLIELMPKEDDGKSVQTRYKLMCGACAGFLSQMASYPIDTVRRRMQLQGAVGSERMYSNAFGCAASVFRKEGLLAFYRGLSANLLRAAPNTAVQFTAYEQLCKWLDLKK